MDFPLHWACQGRSPKIVEMLLQYQPATQVWTRSSPQWHDHPFRPSTGRRSLESLPLHYACDQGSKEMAELLLPYDGDEQVLALRGQEFSPLRLACQSGSPELVELLLQRKPREQLRMHSDNPYYEGILNFACYSGSLETVKKLIEHANLNLLQGEIFEQSRFPLSVACEMGSLEMVKFLLQHQPVRERFERIIAGDLHDEVDTLLPLHHACQRKNPSPQIVSLLLEINPTDQVVAQTAGFPPHHRKPFHLPLRLACARGATQVAQQLLAHQPVEQIQLLSRGWEWSNPEERDMAFDTMVDVFVQGPLEEEHLEYLQIGEDNVCLLRETITRRRRTKSVTGPLGKRGRTESQE